MGEGVGLQKSAKIMNSEGIAAPCGRWSGSTIRAMVFNDLYRGVAIYGRTRWKDQGERKVKEDVPAADWVRVDQPALRLVDEELWTAAHDRLAQTRAAYLRSTDGKLWGRPESGRATPDLLAGLSVCGICGASLFVRKRPNKRHPDRVPYAYYGCSNHHLLGARTCANAMTMPRVAADAAVLRPERGHPESRGAHPGDR